MTIAERDELTAKTIARLRSINSLKDLKSSREEIMDLMERFFRSASEVLNTFFDNMFSLSPAEQEEIAGRVQGDDFLLNPDMMAEFERLEQLPGAEEFMAKFNTDMQERMEPYLEEFSVHLGKLMENFMGGMMSGLAGAMGISDDAETVYEEARPAYDEFNPDTPPEFYSLYSAANLGEFLENKDNFYMYIDQEILPEYLGYLEQYASNDFKELWESDVERIEKIRHIISRFEPEFEKEFDRLASKPGDRDEVEKIRNEFYSMLHPRIDDIKKYLAAAEGCVAEYNSDGSKK